MKKLTRIISGIVAFILIAGILWVANGLIGNPISKFLANRSAKKYIAETYPEMGLEIAKANFNFKDGEYAVFVESPTSIDTHFSLSITQAGRVRWDSYESSVVEKSNTYSRVNMSYRKMVDEIFESEDFPYESDIDFGSLKIKEDGSYESFGPIYGINREELELDKIYDIKELGKTAGELVLYIDQEQINAKKASEILLNIKEIFDTKDIPFYAIDFTLTEPKTEENMRDRESFGVKAFLYSDIYEKGLIRRLEKASQGLADYYENEDAKKEKEIIEVNEN